MELSPLTLIVWGELTFLLAGGLVLLAANSLVKSAKEKKSVKNLLQKVQEDRDRRLAEIKEGLQQYGISGDKLEDQVKSIDKQERRLYQRIAMMYKNRSAGMLCNMNVAVEASSKPYYNLDLTAEAAVEQPSGTGEVAEVDESELKRLQAENERLQEELAVTMDTIGRMLSEYSSMFGTDDEGDLDKGKIMEAFEVDENGEEKVAVESSAAAADVADDVLFDMDEPQQEEALDDFEVVDDLDIVDDESSDDELLEIVEDAEPGTIEDDIAVETDELLEIDENDISPAAAKPDESPETEVEDAFDVDALLDETAGETSKEESDVEDIDALLEQSAEEASTAKEEPLKEEIVEPSEQVLDDELADVAVEDVDDIDALLEESAGETSGAEPEESDVDDIDALLEESAEETSTAKEESSKDEIVEPSEQVLDDELADVAVEDVDDIDALLEESAGETSDAEPEESDVDDIDVLLEESAEEASTAKEESAKDEIVEPSEQVLDDELADVEVEDVDDIDALLEETAEEASEEAPVEADVDDSDALLEESAEETSTAEQEPAREEIVEASEDVLDDELADVEVEDIVDIDELLGEADSDTSQEDESPVNADDIVDVDELIDEAVENETVEDIVEASENVLDDELADDINEAISELAELDEAFPDDELLEIGDEPLLDAVDLSDQEADDGDDSGLGDIVDIDSDLGAEVIEMEGELDVDADLDDAIVEIEGLEDLDIDHLIEEESEKKTS